MSSRWIRGASYGGAALAVLFWLSMVASFLAQGLPAFQHEGLSYLTGKVWHYRGEVFGVLPMIYGSVVVSSIAILLAAPLAVGAALFTAEVLPEKRRWWVKVPVELLAGVPSVVYGLLGVLLLRNWIYALLERWEPLSGDTLLTGGVLLAVMILPTVMTLADDALRGVPGSQRRASRGLGLTRAETVWRVSLPQAAPGILAALLLGLGRALGETIAVFLVVGRQDNQWPERLLSPAPLLEAGQTLTSKLASSETFLAYGDPLHWGAIVGLGLTLMVMVAVLSWVSGRWLPGGADA